MVTPNFDIDCSWQVLHLWQIIHKEDMVIAIVIDVDIDTIERCLSNGAIVNDLEWPWRSLQLWNVYNSIPLKHIPFTSGAVPKYCDEHVCVFVRLCVCLSARISPKPHTRSWLIFLCLLPMAVARSFSGRVTKWQGEFLPIDNAL